MSFRRHTLLPLDDCLYALNPTLPPLTPGRHAIAACGAMASVACRNSDDLVAAVACVVHTVLSDNGVQVADLARNRHGIDPRLTRPNPAWSNAQAERLNRTIKEATVSSV